MIKKIYHILNTVFGYKEFRYNQKEIILSIANKQDLLAVMPTGGGKSLCYQIPSLIFEGITIVVSPLISLMKDQVDQIREFGIEASFLNSSLSLQEYLITTDEIISGKTKLLYVSPETLLLDKTINLLKDTNVSLIAIDEAHCISEWGHDFRPEYRKIKDIKQLFPEAVFAAFTATATERVRKDIVNALQLNNPEVFVSSFNRDNLFLEIAQKYDPLNQVLSFLKKFPESPGIIYCFSRKQVELLTEDLLNQGYKAKPYHAGLSDTVRAENQSLFLKDDIQIIVATIAFGMGINKSNVRFVIHHDMPKNIESYYQEIGRAGRDGLFAHCLLLYSYKDRSKIEYFINQKTSQKEIDIARAHLEDLENYIDFYHCRRIPLLEYFGEDYKNKNCGMCDNCDTRTANMIDITVHAQKFLSSVKRTRESFSVDYNIDILLGKENEFIHKNEHEQLSTFGIGKGLNHKQWLALVKQFEKAELIEIQKSTNVAKVIERGYKILKKQDILLGLIPSVQKHKPVVPKECDEVLLKELKAVRKFLADKNGVPPYVVFSDKTLVEMAAVKPKTKGQLLNINGMGAVKYQKYGDVFLNTLRAYLKEGNEAKPELPKISKTTTEFGEKMNEGMSLLDLVVSTKYKKTTILKHLADYVEAGNQLFNSNLEKELKLNHNAKVNLMGLFTKHEGNEESVNRESNNKYTLEELLIGKIMYYNKK